VATDKFPNYDPPLPYASFLKHHDDHPMAPGAPSPAIGTSIRRNALAFFELSVAGSADIIVAFDAERSKHGRGAAVTVVAVLERGNGIAADRAEDVEG
jgi:hypothetical protein